MHSRLQKMSNLRFKSRQTNQALYLGVLKLPTKHFFDVRGTEKVRFIRVVILNITKIHIIFNGNFSKIS